MTHNSCAPPTLIERFSLRVSAALMRVFDRAKLEWFNQQYLQKLPIEELLPSVQRELERSGLWRPEWAGDANATGLHALWTCCARARAFCRISPRGRGRSFTDDFEYDVEAREKFWKDERLPDLLGAACRRARRAARVDTRRLRPGAAAALRSKRE